jgi:hypothetical protein
MEIMPRSHKNCMEEILAVYNGTEVFVNPTSYAITVSQLSTAVMLHSHSKNSTESDSAVIQNCETATTWLCCQLTRYK